MDLGDRDQQIFIIQAALKDNQDHMVNKLLQLEEAQKRNNLLRTVYDDYKHYYDHIIKQKQYQRQSMEGLVNYLEKMMLEAGLTDNMLKRANYEQKNILEELSGLRKNLNDIVHRHR